MASKVAADMMICRGVAPPPPALSPSPASSSLVADVPLSSGREAGRSSTELKISIRREAFLVGKIMETE